MDRYEVTNKEFKQFIDAGGYRKPEYWKEPFVESGRTFSFREAMTKFRDKTGRQGPSTWEVGDYPEGQADYPVTGVSWYEGAAYAEYTGKSLPTVYDWSNAAGVWDGAHILPLSNFAGKGLSPVGAYQGMSRFGTYDMAGNAKEWCWNAMGAKRFIFGGAWNEPFFMFNDIDARSPFDRLRTFGFRCIKHFFDMPTPKPATDPPSLSDHRNYDNERPVSEEIFKAYKRLYSYDKAPVNALIDSVDENDPRWRKERVTFDAAYGNERMIAYLFLPRHAATPYQPVVFWPHWYAFFLRSIESMDLDLFISFLIRSGRAVIYPIYKGTVERRDGLEKTFFPNMTISYREHVIDWSKDLGRTIDYLQTRDDLNHEKLAYYGLSWGAYLGNILPALENRIKVLVLLGGGFELTRKPPEVDEINFAPRVKV